MTELQRQTSLLRSRSLQSATLSDGRPSLFFSPSDAAAVDVGTIYAAAVQGINTLAQYDRRLDSFSETVLDSSSIEVQRELKTKEVTNHAICLIVVVM